MGTDRVGMMLELLQGTIGTVLQTQTAQLETDKEVAIALDALRVSLEKLKEAMGALLAYVDELDRRITTLEEQNRALRGDCLDQRGTHGQS